MTAMLETLATAAAAGSWPAAAAIVGLAAGAVGVAFAAAWLWRSL